MAVAAACIVGAPAVSRADIIEPFETTAHPFWNVDEVRVGAAAMPRGVGEIRDLGHRLAYDLAFAVDVEGEAEARSDVSPAATKTASSTSS